MLQVQFVSFSFVSQLGINTRQRICKRIDAGGEAPFMSPTEEDLEADSVGRARGSQTHPKTSEERTGYIHVHEKVKC